MLAKVAFTVAVWTDCRRVFNHILTTACQRGDMMNLQKWVSVLIEERRVFAAAFAFPA
jgi:hypothetical protein